MLLIKKLVLPLVCLIILGLMIFKTPPPASFFSASPLQLLILLPTWLFFFCVSNLFFKKYLKSLVLSLSILILIILEGGGVINLASLVILSLGIIIGLTRLSKPKKSPGQTAIPKLSHMNKHK